MITEKVNQLINDYFWRGKESLDRKLAKINKEGTTTKTVLRINGRTIQTINEFLEKEETIIAKLNRCKSIDELSDLAWKTFGSIKYVNVNTINLWVSFKANILDIDTESNCLSWASPSVRDYLAKRRITEEHVINRIKNHLRDINDIKPIYIGDLLNKADKLKLLNDLLR